MEHFNDNEFRKILKELARVAENVLILVPASTSIFQLYDPIGDDDDKRFLSKKKLKQLLSLELSDVKVNYLWKTGGLTISGSGKAR